MSEAAPHNVRLFHFSEDGEIETFAPRPVTTLAPRAPGREWLNGPLVWAIDEWHQPMYLFPRDCPRILCWSVPATSPEDRAGVWGSSSSRMIAYIEGPWLDAFSTTTLYRYELPADGFESLDDAGMWVARQAITPIGLKRIDDLPGALEAAQVELRVVATLASLRRLWATSLHVSGIRLRNSKSWCEAHAERAPNERDHP